MLTFADHLGGIILRFWLTTIVALVLTLPASSAAKDAIELVPRCGGAFQLCGYGEKGSNVMRIPERFEVAQPFSGGLAAVRIEGKWGYIDRVGNIVIRSRFKAAGPFAGDYAEVRIGDASGIIDRSGRVVVPARFGRIMPFNNGTFLAEPLRDNRSSAEATDGRLGGLANPLALLGRSGAGLYHIRKGWLTDQDLNFDRFDAPERGLIWAGKRNAQGDDEWGLLRSDGSWEVTPRYSHVQSVNETHAVVNSMPDSALPPGERRDSVRWGAVDRSGKLVVPLKFAYLSYWRGGYGYAKEVKPYNSNGIENNVREGIVRSDGSLLGDRYFDKVDIREDGTLPRVRVGKIWYSIEPSGTLIPDQLDGMPLVECAGGLTIVHRGEEAEFLRPGDSRPVGRFENTYFQKRDCPGPFSARRGSKWFFVMEGGTVLGGQTGYDTTYSFSGTHSPVQVDGKWGIIDRTGKFTVEPRFAKLQPDRNGTFAVGEGQSTYWIDASGKRVEQPVIERPTPDQALTCQGGLRFFQNGDRWGLQDATGKTVIEPRYRALSCFKQGVSWTASAGGDSWCPIGPDGKRREAMDCRQTYYPMILTHHYPEKFSENPFENSVLWTRAWLDYQAGHRAEPPRWISDFGNGGTYSVMGGSASAEAFGSAPAGERASVPAIAILGSLLMGLAAHWWWTNARSRTEG
jgi:hypothetical protein